jgi:hypothetical protein
LPVTLEGVLLTLLIGFLLGTTTLVLVLSHITGVS